MKTNTIHHCDFLDNELPDGCAKLIIADPPYFEVKGKFDFIWSSFDAYLVDVEKWVKECARILADNGTLFWWGHAKKIAYSQIIIDKYLSLLNSIVWQKTECQTKRASSELMRSFIPVTERILMYSKEGDETGLEKLMDEHIKPKHPFANYLKAEFRRAGKELREIRRFVVDSLGFDSAMINRWLEGNSIMKEEIYLKFREYLNGDYLRKEYDYLRKEYDYLRKEYEDLRKEYEDLRKEYEDQRRYFNNPKKLEDVLTFSQEANHTGKYKHPTQKPPKLTRELIRTTTRKGDLVVIPFAGSGTECAMSADLQRPFIGYEIDEKHVKTARKRCKVILSQPKLF